MASVLPILKSFVQPEALAAQISEAYGLEVVRCQLIKATMRDVYRVESDQGRFIATLYNHAESVPALVFAEQVFTNFLMRKDAPVITALPTRDEQYVLLLPFPEGSRYLALFPFVRGNPMSRRPQLRQVTRYGEAVAHIHQAADAYRGPLTRPVYQTKRLLWEPLDILQETLAEQLGSWKELQYVAEYLASQLQHYSTRRPTFGMIHGDVIPSNVLFANSGLTVIDFDLCGYGWRMYDVASFLNEAAFWEMGSAAEEAFLEGYASVLPLSEADRAMIPVMGAVRSIWALGNAAAHVNTWGYTPYLTDQVINGLLQTLRGNLDRLR